VGEPHVVAHEVLEVVPGVWHWSVHDDRIDFISSSHAVMSGDGVVLVDPLPLAPDALESLGSVTAIVLTTSSHQRSAWRLRRELGVQVHAPALTKESDEQPDSRYAEGDRLPGDLQAIFTPGAGTTQHSLLLEQHSGVLFTPDLFAHPPGGTLVLVPDRYMHDSKQARRTAQELLARPFAVLCTGHGAPVLEDAHGAVRAALAA